MLFPNAECRMLNAPSKILLIRLGALGDLVLCMGAFAAIRKKHPGAEIALLTMPAFQGFARQMPWIDKIIIDPRPRFSDISNWLQLARDVRAFAPDFVFDLQGKFRQTILFNLLGRPQWSGAALFCSHPRPWPPVKGMHYTDFLEAQLKAADVEMETAPDLSWLAAEVGELLDTIGEENNPPLAGGVTPPAVSKTNDKLRFALFISGCAPNRPYKRWPAENYAALAKKFAEQGIVCAAVGTKADEDSIEAIRALAPSVISLAGKTTLPQLGHLARKAVCVIGNDTGPTHLAAAVGAKTIALMSDQVDPKWSSPKGSHTTWLQGKPLAALSVQEVWDKINALSVF